MSTSAFVASQRQADLLSNRESGYVTNARDAAAHTLDFYSQIPQFELCLDEFEEFALLRLKVLRKIDELSTRTITRDKKQLELDATIKENLVDPAENIKNLQRLDQASHFILRAAYCRSEDLRNWFLTQECILFRHRLMKIVDNVSGAVIMQKIFKKYNLVFEQVEQTEKVLLRDKLMSCPIEDSKSDGTTAFPAEFDKTTYYKIPFVKALNLVKHRSVYIQGGYAYVPTSRMVSILVQRFRMDISRSLVHASASFDEITENSRIGPLLQSMNQQYLGKEFNGTEGIDGDQLTSTNIELLSESMPLCMLQCHKGLKREHHLKHHARVQYGFFLKGAGMSMEEQLAHMSREFSKLSSQEDYNKKYAYNVRHLYGKEGGRKNYPPKNCQKIIMGPVPQNGEHHGCPFRHSTSESLTSMLRSMRIGEPDIKSMVKLKEEKQFNLACQKHFLVTHPGAENQTDCIDVGNHPNAWFKSSRSYHTAVTNRNGLGNNTTFVKT